jgi:hypothetical protein
MGAGDVAVRDVVRAVVESKAGHELAYFGKLTRFDDSWALWCLRRRRGRDESLAFGPGETAALITSVVWIAINEAAKDFGTAAGDGMFVGLRALLRRLLRRKPRRVVVPPLTGQQRDKVCDTVEKELRKARLSEKRAKDVANAVFRELSKGFPLEAGADPAVPDATTAKE